MFIGNEMPIWNFERQKSNFKKKFNIHIQESDPCILYGNLKLDYNKT